MYCKSLIIIAVLSYINLAESSLQITGGKEIGINEAPHQLSLRDNGKHKCGAAIIHTSWATSSVKCVRGVNKNSATLKSGSASLSNGGTIHKISKIIPHESFNSSTNDYDIALIQVSDLFDLKKVKAITLASDGAIIKSGSIVTITGWGLLTYGGKTYPDKLQQTTVPIVDDKICKGKYKSFTDRMFCAGRTTGGQDICDGDFGGPMAYQNKLYGISSASEKCGAVGNYGTYTAIPKVRGWIKNKCGV